MGGANDCGSCDADEIFANLQNLVKIAAKALPMSHIGVLTIPRASCRSTKGQGRCAAVNDKLRATCVGKDVPFLVDLEGVDTNLTFDGLHFTAEGYLKFAKIAHAAMQH